MGDHDETGCDGGPGCPWYRPTPFDIEIEPGCVWEDVLDFVAQTQRTSALRGAPMSRDGFDELLSEETDFSPTARQVVWELAQALGKDPRWIAPRGK